MIFLIRTGGYPRDRRTDGNFCGRRRRGWGPADGAPAAAAAAEKFEKTKIVCGRTDGFFSARPIE